MNEQMPTPTCLSCQRHSVAIALLQEQNDALTLQNELLEARIKALEAKLGTNSTNSHRPASTDPPSKPNKAQKKRAKRKSRKAKARKQGAQPGHKHHERTLAPLTTSVSATSTGPIIAKTARHLWLALILTLPVIRLSSCLRSSPWSSSTNSIA